MRPTHRETIPFPLRYESGDNNAPEERERSGASHSESAIHRRFFNRERLSTGEPRGRTTANQVFPPAPPRAPSTDAPGYPSIAQHRSPLEARGSRLTACEPATMAVARTQRSAFRYPYTFLIPQLSPQCMLRFGDLCYVSVPEHPVSDSHHRDVPIRHRNNRFHGLFLRIHAFVTACLRNNPPGTFPPV